MHKISRAIILGLAFLGLSTAEAGLSPLAVSIFPPVQFPSNDVTITGARFNILWGKHRNVYGFDFGALGSVTEQNISGVQISGLANVNGGMANIVGLQLAGITNVNVNKLSLVGLQVAAGVNSNKAESTLLGFQIAGLANLSPHTKIMGVQVGLYNTAREIYGLQIGLINSTDSLHGIQIGLVNFNKKGPFTVAPVLNVSF